jgi:hypothetical protein
VGCSSVCAEGGAGCGTRGGRGSLPCVASETHGNGFSLPCVFAKTHGKGFFAVRFLIRRTANLFSTIFVKFIKNFK